MESNQNNPVIVEAESTPLHDPIATSENSALFADRYKSDTNDRKWLAQWSAIIVSIWMMFILFFIHYQQEKQGLSDTVMVTLLGTTTVNVLGLMYIVLRGHFSKNNKIGDN